MKPKSLSLWLFICAGMVFAMMIIGAITRLTESGLSMVVWEPFIGAIPPLNEKEWLRVFALYKATPEFQKVNFWMELEDFKNIFFWEWFHRLWGRLIGLVYGLPLLYFWIRKQIPSDFKIPLIGLLFLGGMQGFVGWFMVQSGLIDNPAVSHFRLALHLLMAFLLYGLLIWCGLKIRSVNAYPNKKLFCSAIISLCILTITICWGAFVAGMDAGLIYNEWPLMEGRFIPQDMWFLKPAILNFIENPAAVQFTHRWLAFIALGSVLYTCYLGFQTTAHKKLSYTAGGIVIFQVLLGISTLLSKVWIPLAALHQAGAAILFGILILLIYKSQPIRHNPAA